jgi:hypothetical protein
MPDKDESKEAVKVEAPVEVKVAERKSASKPIVAADGHVVLSQEDINARDS